MGLKSVTSNLLKSKLAKNSAVYVLAELINKAIPFLILPVLTAYLSTEDYGIVSNYEVLCNFLILFVGLSTHTAVTVNFFKIPEEKIKIYVTNVLIVLLASTLLFLIFFYAFGWVFEENMTIPFYWGLLAVIFSSAQFLNTLLIKIYVLKQKPFVVSLFQIGKTIMNVGLTLWLIISLGMDWSGRILGTSIAAILFALIAVVSLFRLKLISYKFDKEYFIDSLRIGVPLIPHQLSSWVKNGVDKIFITGAIGMAANGVFSLGFQLAFVLLILFQSINQAMVPFVFQKLKDDSEKTKKEIVKICYLVGLGTIVVVLLASLIAPPIFSLIINESYHESLSLLPLLMIAFGFKGLYFLVVQFLIYVKSTALLAKITFGVSLFHVGVSYSLINIIGIKGACVSLIISEFITFIIVAYFSNKKFPMPWLYFLQEK